MSSLHWRAPGAFGAGAMVALVCAAGCAHAPPAATAETAAMQQVVAPTSIVDFVSKADVGQAGSVSPAPGQDAVTVRVLNAYAAASGRTCRQYTVTDGTGHAGAHLACSGDQGWTEVRPLILGDGARSP